MDTSAVNEKADRLINIFDYAEKKGVRVDTGLAHFALNGLMGQKGLGVYCRAMGGEICVHPNGEVYPCGALNIRLGTIYNIDAVFKSKAYHDMVNRVAGNIPSCRGCEIEAFCAGGCAADAYAANGAVNAPAENCELERRLFKEMVEQYVL